MPTMTETDPILRYAREAIASGVDQFTDLVDACLEETDLKGAARGGNSDPALYLFGLLMADPWVHFGLDDRVVRIDLHSDGLVFTHRLLAAEIEGHRVAIVPDLAVLHVGADGLVTEDGHPIEMDVPADPEAGPFAEGSFVGPPEWLSDFSEGDLVAFRRMGDTVVVEPATLGRHGAEVELLDGQISESWAEGDGIGVDIGELLFSAIFDEPENEVFRAPVAPVAELIAEAGLKLDRVWVGPADEDWEDPDELYDRDLRGALVERYGLAVCCIKSLDVVVGGWRAFARGEDVDFRKVNDELDHGVSDAAWDYLFYGHNADSARIEDFASELIGAAGGDRSGSAHHLRALAREIRGATLEAEEDLHAAIRVDPENAAALEDLATYLSDRGDAAEVVSLLRRAGVDDDHPMLLFHQSLGAAPAVGRNEPCPCGSGRKFKQCHLGRPILGPAEQVRWLVAKVASFVGSATKRGRLLQLASTAAQAADAEDIDQMLTEDWIIFLTVFEGGGVEDYLVERGMLLPEVERDLLELWTLATLELWEVVETDGQSQTTLLHTRTGERVEITDRTAASTLSPGEQALARTIDGLGHTWLAGVILRITTRHREGLIELLDSDPTADDFAAWYGSIHAPPTISNQEGEDLHIITGVLHPTVSWKQLSAFLDDTYEPLGDGEWQETLRLDDEEQIVRAVLRQRGDELVVDVNSWERFDRVVETLADHAEVYEASAADPRDGPKPDGSAPIPDLDDDALSEIQDRMERKWLGEPVPALGGLTPRQAAADPTRRQDLIDLLRSFDDFKLPEGAIGFRTDVLRQELGIDPADGPRS